MSLFYKLAFKEVIKLQAEKNNVNVTFLLAKNIFTTNDFGVNLRIKQNLEQMRQSAERITLHLLFCTGQMNLELLLPFVCQTLIKQLKFL